ncbi:MAG TPA: thiamine phosphate synthase [Acidobacteriaceae bacterium]|jgi:thiamine-phosphate pyrophosphorylase|nr:thiamine phosphate synthase [Acidobacteriaceae bacterium]
MVRCAITNGMHAELDDTKASCIDLAGRCARNGIEFVQLREKHLEASALLELAEAMQRALRAEPAMTKLLINGRPDVAVAAGADGVHLSSRCGELTPAQVRAIFVSSGRPLPFVSVSCHHPDEAGRAAAQGADLILFGPVFEKRVGDELVGQGLGLGALAAACSLAAPVRVLALGGVTAETWLACHRAGAQGFAGIRAFL